jgi:hypothetical protein
VTSRRRCCERAPSAGPKKGDPGLVTERRIKAVNEALLASGVEVDSQNYMRTGPFRMWRV